jgi:hypothetical protein
VSCMGTSLMIGTALGASELASGFRKAGKDMKTVNRKANPYDLKMNPNTQGLQMSVDSAAEQMRTAESMTIYFMEKVAGDTQSPDRNQILKTYGIPAGVAAVALARGRMTGNYLQFPFYDTANFVKKVAPRMTTSFLNMQAKNPNIRGKARFATQVAAKTNQANQAAAKSVQRSLGREVASGGAWIGGGVLVEDAINRSRHNSNQQTFEKQAKEVPNTPLNHFKKVLIEGVAHPSVKAVPIYVAPVALGYALNKDIKSGDFAPVRDMTKEQKAKKNEANKSQIDFASYNNAVVNNQLLSMASLAEGYEKVAALKVRMPRSVKGVFRRGKTQKIMPDGTVSGLKQEKPATIKIKDWRDLPEDAAIAGLGAASMMVPIAMMAKSDPIQHVKKQIEAESAAMQQRQKERDQKNAIKKAIRKEVRKEVNKTVG